MTVPSLPPPFEKALADLLEVADSSPTRAGVVARVLAELLGELAATTSPDLADLSPAHRIDHLYSVIETLESRVTVLELALTETNRRVPSSDWKPPAPGDRPVTLFGIPVNLADGVSVERVRAAVDAAPKGLSGEQVVKHLADAGLVREVKS